MSPRLGQGRRAGRARVGPCVPRSCGCACARRAQCCAERACQNCVSRVLMGAGAERALARNSARWAAAAAGVRWRLQYCSSATAVRFCVLFCFCMFQCFLVVGCLFCLSHVAQARRSMARRAPSRFVVVGLPSMLRVRSSLSVCSAPVPPPSVAPTAPQRDWAAARASPSSHFPSMALALRHGGTSMPCAAKLSAACVTRKRTSTLMSRA